MKNIVKALFIISLSTGSLCLGMEKEDDIAAEMIKSAKHGNTIIKKAIPALQTKYGKKIITVNFDHVYK